MKTRVLFLDDEQSLLNGIQRRLGFDYDMTCCNAGEDALKVMRESGPFAVAVTDMRMPKMDGVQFIRQARVVSPDTVFVMLTGNQDQTTVIQAMNEGQVFRFLNKPCDHDALRRTVDSALHQHRLITSEKELLHKTFVGAVSVLTEVLEISQPAIYSQAANIEELIHSLAIALEINERWEYKLSARLSLLGLTFLTDQERDYLETSSPLDSKYQEIYGRSMTTSCRLIEKIPRLQPISQIISSQSKVDGSMHGGQDKESPTAIVHIGATLLRVATLWNSLTRSGICPEAAIKEVRALLPELCPMISNTLIELNLYCGQQVTVELAVDELHEGLILAEDVVSADGSILLRQGRRLSWATIEKLRQHHANLGAIRPVAVVASSRDAEKSLV